MSGRRIPGGAASIALLAIACAFVASCAATAPDIEFACSSPTWSTDTSLGTTYSIHFETTAVAIPWPCSAIVYLDLYDLDGYVHALGAYVIDIDATVELDSLEMPWYSGVEHVMTVDLASFDAPRSSTSYTNIIRGVRAVVPRQVEFRPDNSLLHPAWWLLPFEAVEEDGALAGYLADSLPD